MNFGTYHYPHLCFPRRCYNIHNTTHFFHNSIWSSRNIPFVNVYRPFSHAWKVQQRVSWSIVLPLDMVEDGVELFEEETPSSDPL